MARSPLHVLLATQLILSACSGQATATPPIVPGSPADPREVIIVARDYSYSPPVVDLVPGETVTFQVLNGGLIVHDLVIGGPRVQEAWEAAEAATVGAPPGPTPVVSVPPNVGGLRIVVASGERADRTWTVPLHAAAEPGGWFAACHIPGHAAQGMIVPVRFVGRDGLPLPTPSG
jgi:uncharacterized cupredoxin-like copper-binding protein